jgi:hypothetical protein
VFKACVAPKNNLSSLCFEEAPLTRILDAEDTPTYLLEQQEAPICERGTRWAINEDFGMRGALTPQRYVSGFPVSIDFILRNGLPALRTANILNRPPNFG